MGGTSDKLVLTVPIKTNVSEKCDNFDKISLQPEILYPHVYHAIHVNLFIFVLFYHYLIINYIIISDIIYHLINIFLYLCILIWLTHGATLSTNASVFHTAQHLYTLYLFSVHWWVPICSINTWRQTTS